MPPGSQASDGRSRVVFLTHYYPPERGAPQTRLHETARLLQSLGHGVQVVTGPPHYPDGLVRPGYRAIDVRREDIDGVPVLRLPMIPRRNGGLIDRVIDQGSFAAVALAAAGEVRQADVTLVESPPLFLGLTAAAWRGVTGRPYIFHVADPWPDYPVEMGALRDPRLVRLAYWMESVSYAHASLITTVTPGLVELIDAKPSARGKVRLLPNAVDTLRFQPERRPSDARAQLGWPEARLTLVYAGSVGLPHGLATLLDAVAPLADEGIVIHVVGEGFEWDRLARQAVQRGLGHVRFEGPFQPDRIPEVLAAADGILVLVRAGALHEHTLPTKLLEGLAAGRPVLVAAPGESAKIVSEAGAGIVAAPEDPSALRGAIRSFAAAAAPEREAMGRAARVVAETNHDRRAIVKRLSEYLTEAAEGRPVGRSAERSGG